MISVDEAKTLINQRVRRLESVRRSLLKATLCVLAEDVVAGCDIPAFEQSSMDGYAIRFEDRNNHLPVEGEMAAGTATRLQIRPGTAVRIFTGAPLPPGADTVVMQEKVTREAGSITISDELLVKGFAVRGKGSEIHAGDLALHSDTLLTPAAIGFLAGIGVSQVVVYPMPSVTILVTGNELQAPGEPLEPGHVYESNSYSLTAALSGAGVTQIRVVRVEDNLRSLSDQLASVLEWSDLVILTGGVSVGDYDFVLEASARCEVETVFHKVKQKPGKPLFFGMKGATPVFGLPGNPSSVLSCFYNYVLPAVEMLSGKQASARILKAVLDKGYSKPAGLTHFLKATYKGGRVTILGGQQSYQLSSFAQANCLLVLEEQRDTYVAGEEVEILLLPG